MLGPICLLLLGCGGGENCSDDDFPDVHDDTLSVMLPNSILSTFDNWNENITVSLDYICIYACTHLHVCI